MRWPQDGDLEVTLWTESFANFPSFGRYGRASLDSVLWATKHALANPHVKNVGAVIYRRGEEPFRER